MEFSICFKKKHLSIKFTIYIDLYSERQTDRGTNGIRLFSIIKHIHRLLIKCCIRKWTHRDEFKLRTTPVAFNFAVTFSLTHRFYKRKIVGKTRLSSLGKATNQRKKSELKTHGELIRINCCSILLLSARLKRSAFATINKSFV